MTPDLAASRNASEETSVHPLVDARQSRGHLVDSAMEVVDAGLQRYGEVDEIVLVAPDQHLLRLAHAP